MILNNAKNIMLGNHQVSKIYQGNHLVWRSSELPIGYKRCEYLDNEGKTQYIDLGQKYELTDSFSIVMSAIGTGDDQLAFGIYPPNFSIGIYGQSTTKFWRFNVESVHKLTIPVEVGKINHFTYNPTSRKWAIDGVVDGINAGTHGVKKSLWLFARNYGSIDKSFIMHIRVYSLNIKRDGNDVMNLIPCLDPKGRPCMYDTVTQQPFYNSGTGEFLYKLA